MPKSCFYRIKCTVLSFKIVYRGVNPPREQGLYRITLYPVALFPPFYAHEITPNAVPIEVRIVINV